MFGLVEKVMWELDILHHPVVFSLPAPSARMGGVGGRKLIHAAALFLKNAHLRLRCRLGLLDAYLIWLV